MNRMKPKANAFRERVRKIQGRAKFVGVMYMLGIFALVATLFLPVSNASFFAVAYEGNFNIVQCVKGIIALIKENGFAAAFTSPSGVLTMALSLLYIILFLVLVINALRSLGKLGWLFKRRASYIHGYNRNMYAMDDLAKLYSSSFGAVLILNLLFILFGEWTGFKTSITLLGYIVVGVGLLLHFVLGLVGGSVTLFTKGKDAQEEKRDHGLLIYFIRNFLQVAAVGAILYFYIPNTLFADGIRNILSTLLHTRVFANLIHITSIYTYVEIVAWISIFVLLKHATAQTEYNRDCNRTRGMKNYVVFSLIAALCLAAMIILPYVVATEEAPATLNKPLLWAAIIAFVMFLFDMLCRAKDVKGEEKAEEVTEDAQQNAPMMPMGMMQPMFMPMMYYPVYPQQNANGAPMMPMMPMMQAMPLTEANETEKASRGLNPAKRYRVRCPKCGTELYAKGSAEYHRCPACDKVFQLRRLNDIES